MEAFSLICHGYLMAMDCYVLQRDTKTQRILRQEFMKGFNSFGNTRVNALSMHTASDSNICLRLFTYVYYFHA